MRDVVSTVGHAIVLVVRLGILMLGLLCLALAVWWGCQHWQSRPPSQAQILRLLDDYPALVARVRDITMSERSALIRVPAARPAHGASAVPQVVQSNCSPEELADLMSLIEVFHASRITLSTGTLRIEILHRSFAGSGVVHDLVCSSRPPDWLDLANTSGEGDQCVSLRPGWYYARDGY